MKNSENLELQELTLNQMKEIDGGVVIPLILAGIGLCLAAYTAGYMTGKAIF